ncbi:MAG: DUF4296 domain-containing protein [Prevotella sp.]|nr:DUF4296 domain-containing protein [Prevotella sp.]
MVQKRTLIPLLVCALILAMSCTKDIPHFSEGEMEDILYDYHMAQSMAMIEGDANNGKLYTDAVLKKYGVTQAEFDSSMIYYLRHSEDLRDIYKDVVERMNNEALASGGVNGIITNVEYSPNGDTANIWSKEKYQMLTNHAPYNKMYFTLKADTSYHKGDNFLWNVNTHFIYQDGYKNLTCVLYAKYDNDSIAIDTRTVSYDGPLQIFLSTPIERKIKTLSGFMYLNKNANQSETTLQLLFLDNIRLLKMHVKPNATSSTTADKDTVNSSDSPVPVSGMFD